MTTPCGNCGTLWRHTDRIGCCSACHRAFSGISAFDAHQVGPRDVHGRLTCLDPEAAIYPPGHRRYGQRVFAPVSRVPDIANGQLWTLTVGAEDAARMLRLSERRSEERARAKAAKESGAA